MIQIKKNNKYSYLSQLPGWYQISNIPISTGSHGDQDSKETKTRRSIDTTVFETLWLSNTVNWSAVRGSVSRGSRIHCSRTIHWGGRRMCRRGRAYPGASAFITRLSRLRLHVVTTRWIILDMTPAYWLDGVVSGGQQFEVD